MVKAIGWLTAAAVLAWAGSATAQHAGSAAKNGSSGVAAKSAPKASANAQTRARPAKQRTAARPARPSEGQIAGLHRVDDPLDLRSSVALVVNQDTDEVLFEKNPHAVLPIASITKLMTALVTLDAGLDQIGRAHV